MLCQENGQVRGVDVERKKERKVSEERRDK